MKTKSKIYAEHTQKTDPYQPSHIVIASTTRKGALSSAHINDVADVATETERKRGTTTLIRPSKSLPTDTQLMITKLTPPGGRGGEEKG